jgi:hypothetical protein
VTTLEQELKTNPYLDYLRRERGMEQPSSGLLSLGPRWS